MAQAALRKQRKKTFDLASQEGFKLSRSKLELFFECRRCFYFDRRLGIVRPPSYPYTLNSAVDRLLKKEFDFYRAQGITPPLLKENGINAIPFAHPQLEQWRNSLGGGIGHLHPATNFKVYGGIDDLWINENKELIVVDYKSTAKNGQVGIDDDWQISYKRQIEMYQWLFRQNGFKVSNTSYFVYCNADLSRQTFDKVLNFSITLLPYVGSNSWIETALREAKECLTNSSAPANNNECKYCRYVEALASAERV